MEARVCLPPVLSTLLFWGRFSHWCWGSSIGIEWPARELKRSACLCRLCWIRDVLHDVWLLHGCWEFRLRSSWFQGKHLTRWTVSPTWIFVLVFICLVLDSIPSWYLTCYVFEDDLKLLIFLSLPPECLDYMPETCCPPRLCFVWSKIRTLFSPPL